MAKRSRAQGSKQLRPRQVALLKNLVVGMTITEAARRAGYSRKCPGQAGYRLSHLAKPLEKNRRVGSNRHARQPVRSPPVVIVSLGPFAPTPLIKRFQADQDGLLPT